MLRVKAKDLVRILKGVDPDTVKYGLSIYGRVPLVGPLTFEEMLHYLDTEALK